MPYLLFIALLIATYPTHISYYAEAYQYQELYRNNACAIDTCPERIVNGFVSLKELEHGTKEYWRVYCGELKDTVLACK